MKLTKVEKKVSLNIKISTDMDFRLKRARKAARGQGMMFNVSQEVESFLEKELKKVEKDLGLHEDYKTDMMQVDIMDAMQDGEIEGHLFDAPEKVEKSKPARRSTKTTK
ncbi:hypothetical protein ACPV5Q_20345 [Vibrio astriarenae]